MTEWVRSLRGGLPGCLRTERQDSGGPSGGLLEPELRRKRLADRAAIALQGGDLHVRTGLQLAHDGGGGPHPRSDQGLAEPGTGALDGKLSREDAAPRGLRDEIRKSRILPGALGNQLVQEVLGHARRMMRGSHSVKAISCTLWHARASSPAPFGEA